MRHLINLKTYPIVLSAWMVFGLLYTAPMVLGNETQVAYRRAESSLERLLQNPEKKKYRHHWIACINKFKAVYRSQPDGPWADDAVFMVGKIYGHLYRYSSKQNDRDEAIDHYRRLLKRFPNTPYKKKASSAIIALQARKKTSKRYVTNRAVPVKRGVVKNRSEIGKGKKKETVHEEESPRQVAVVESLRFWSSPNYTRVVIDVGDEVTYAYHLLKRDPSIGTPQRLYIDLQNARIGTAVQQIVPIEDDLLSDARAGQYKPTIVRVVVDIKTIDSFEVFSLKNPFRVVIDVSGFEKKRTSKRVARVDDQRKKDAEDIQKGSLARQLALGVRRIVIDAGHGGKDPGAIGYDRHVLEKNVTLEVAKRVSVKIRQQLGIETFLTRQSDIFLTLEERTAIANTKNADIFVSIHANANRNRRMRGVETYFLNLATDEEAIRVAARENATSTKTISDMEAILSDLMKNAKIHESRKLAQEIQKTMAKKLRERYQDVQDLGVKQAPFYVLLGAKMPSVLVEVSFISNPTECRRLNTAGYQDALADAIVAGLDAYISEISQSALKGSFKDLQARR